jgi:ADP-ribose pyrophosphatase YjhB (NUDIX family)
MVKCGDKILLCKRNSQGSSPGMWSIPGGKMEDNGETPQEGAKREFLEETGISVKNLDPFRTMDMPNKVISVFVCKDFSGNLEPGSDLSDALWLDVHNLPKLKYNGAELILKAYKKSS